MFDICKIEVYFQRFFGHSYIYWDNLNCKPFRIHLTISVWFPPNISIPKAICAHFQMLWEYKSLSDIALKIYSPIVFIIGCCQHIARYDLMYFCCPWCWIHDWNQNKPRENLIPVFFPSKWKEVFLLGQEQRNDTKILDTNFGLCFKWRCCELDSIAV